MFVGDQKEGISKEDLVAIKEQVFEFIDFSRNVQFLKSLAEVIVKIYVKLEEISDLLQSIVSWGENESSNAREFAMTNLEILADVHIPTEMFEKYIKEFAGIFQKGLSDGDLVVRIATLKACSSFITSLKNNDLILEFSPIMEPLLNTTIEALKEDEDKGRASLEALIVLTECTPEIWKPYIENLVDIISQVMMNSDFEPKTRSSAKEIILSIADMGAGMLRKSKSIQTQFFPAIMSMIAEPTFPEDSDLDEWANTIDEQMVTSNDVETIGKEALARFAVKIGEATTMTASSELIKDSIQSDDWKTRMAGYNYLGYISEGCKKMFSQNLDEIMKMAASGVVDPHPRVRFAGLSCLGLILTDQAPKAQK